MKKYFILIFILIPLFLFSLEDDYITRKLNLDIYNSGKLFDPHTNLWFSFNQLAGRNNNFIAHEFQLDDTLLGRIITFSHGITLLTGIKYYAHEIAHELAIRKNSSVDLFELDWGKFFFIWPKYHYADNYTIWLYTLPPLERFRNAVNGLNQEEIFSFEGWKQNNISDKMSFYDSLTFLISKINDILYIVYTGNIDLSNKLPEKPGLTEKEFIDYYLDNDLHYDVDLYPLSLFNNGINLTKYEYLFQMLLSDFLTYHTWESLFSIYNYFAHGERVSQLFSFNLFNTLNIYPPIINHFLTMNGSFYNVTSKIKLYQTLNIFLSFGFPAPFGENRVNTYRLGVQFDFPEWHLIKFTPYIYSNFNNNFQYQGISIGFNTEIKIFDDFYFKGKLEYNNEDIIENLIKGELNGVDFSVGTAYKF